MRDSVEASTLRDPGYVGNGLGTIRIESNAVSSTFISAATCSCLKRTLIEPTPSGALLTERIVLVSLSKTNIPATLDMSNSVRGSEVTSTVRSAYLSSTTIVAAVVRPAAAAAPPGATNSTGCCRPTPPLIRTVADNAGGNDTLANTWPDAISCLALGDLSVPAAPQTALPASPTH